MPHCDSVMAAGGVLSARRLGSATARLSCLLAPKLISQHTEMSTGYQRGDMILSVTAPYIHTGDLRKALVYFCEKLLLDTESGRSRALAGH